MMSIYIFLVLVALKVVIKEICNIQLDFPCWGKEEKAKTNLVGWDKF